MIIGNFRNSNLHSSQSAAFYLCHNDKHTRTQLANKTSSGSTRSRCSELFISRVSNKFFTRQHLITFFPTTNALPSSLVFSTVAMSCETFRKLWKSSFFLSSPYYNFQQLFSRFYIRFFPLIRTFNWNKLNWLYVVGSSGSPPPLYVRSASVFQLSFSLMPLHIPLPPQRAPKSWKNFHFHLNFSLSLFFF